MSNEQPARPPSPWARFARPAAPDADRGGFPFGPPRPLHPYAPAPEAGGHAWPLDAPYGAAVPQQSAPTGDAAGRQVWAPTPGPDVTTTPTSTVDGPHRPGVDHGGQADTRSRPDASPDVTGLGSYFFPADDDWTSTPTRADDAGRGLAIASVVFGVFFAPLGLVFGIVAIRRARREGRPATLAIVGTVLASIMIVVGTVYAVSALGYYSQLATACAQLGPGDYVNADGQTVRCD